MKPIAHLPDEAVTKLKTLKAENPPLFDSLILGLREAGWPLRAIAEPFDVSRVTVKNWESRAIANSAQPTVGVWPVPLDARGIKVRPKRIPPDVPTKDRQRIAELSDQARRVRRWTADNAPEKKAANELEDLIYQYVVIRKVPAAVFARYANVTRRAIMQRIEKMKDDIIKP